jgi:uncharacterized protein YerC
MERRSRNSLITLEHAASMLRNPVEAQSFFAAVLSEVEYQRLCKRWHAYQLRARGMPLAKIVPAAKIAMTTATRAAALRRTPHREILDTLISRALRDDSD